MSRGSIKYIDTSYMYQAQSVSAPVSNPVIYGHFPKFAVHKNSSTEKINKCLSSLLLGFVVLSLVSYYFVSDGEKNMNLLGREIVALTNENIELQNKLDNLHSFNRIDTVIQNNNKLDTAKKVIEIESAGIPLSSKIQPAAVNYNWSMGY